MTSYPLPGLSEEDCATLAEVLQERLSALNDLHLTLKHVHWNVVGPNFIAVHEMLDPQVDLARDYADDIAERIAALGASPRGTVGAINADRSWDDYSLDRDSAPAHLAALDLVYTGVVASHRKAVEKVGEVDPVTEDLLVSQLGELEKFQWFIRAHLESSGGPPANAGTHTEREAAASARDL